MHDGRIASRHVVLLGAGHTNSHVLRMWQMHAPQDTSLTCISNDSIATYSGMLPAMLAGQVSVEDMEIDLVRLCGASSTRLVTDLVTGHDPDLRLLEFEDRPPIYYDALSVGVGSVPSFEGVETQAESELVLPIKPMQDFAARLSSRVQRVVRERAGQPLRVVVVGSGVAGTEIALCIPPFLRAQGVREFSLRIVSRSESILSELAVGARKHVEAELKRRGVGLLSGRAVKRIGSHELGLDGGESVPADVVIWATGATPPEVLGKLALPVDSRGFLAIDATLRSISGKPVFAVGDSGSMLGKSVPKAGVYAVRQGPVLWENLQRVLRNAPLKTFRPQGSFLRLINLGNDRAVGQWRGFAFEGRWAMRLKHKIDGDFIEKYRPAAMRTGDETMQCRGCGCKLGATSLAAVIQGSEPTSEREYGDGLHTRTISGVEAEDAVVIGGRLNESSNGNNGESRLVASTDFFTMPFEDAFLNGRIAALHSASDVLASGARVTEALANVVLPEGDAAAQRRMLADFLAGARREFRQLGGRLVGGHTIVGPRFEAGFTVIGRQAGAQLLRKRHLQPGDQLLLTKPLGIGVLLAAQMRLACRATDYAGAVRAMLEHQSPYVDLALASGVTACTDVTGFGLAGHLLEMLDASGAAASLKLETIPILSGAIRAIGEGIESSLIDENLRCAARIDASDLTRQAAAYRLLFDPQTCGGLLFGVAAERLQAFQRECQTAGLVLPSRIGEVHARSVMALAID